MLFRDLPARREASVKAHRLSGRSGWPACAFVFVWPRVKQSPARPMAATLFGRDPASFEQIADQTRSRKILGGVLFIKTAGALSDKATTQNDRKFEARPALCKSPSRRQGWPS